MKVVWAPWRMAYIKQARKPARCIFCSKARERRDAANLLLHRGRLLADGSPDELRRRTGETSLEGAFVALIRRPAAVA